MTQCVSLFDIFSYLQCIFPIRMRPISTDATMNKILVKIQYDTPTQCRIHMITSLSLFSKKKEKTLSVTFCSANFFIVITSPCFLYKKVEKMLSVTFLLREKILFFFNLFFSNEANISQFLICCSILK